MIPGVDVFCTCVMFRIFCQSLGAHVVDMKRKGQGGSKTQLTKKIPKPQGFLAGV
jgi:hypothetical protein